MDQAQRLRDLATWYREFAERTENPAIWDARLRTAERLEEEANSLEQRCEGPMCGQLIINNSAVFTRSAVSRGR